MNKINVIKKIIIKIIIIIGIKIIKIIIRL